LSGDHRSWSRADCKLLGEEECGAVERAAGLVEEHLVGADLKKDGREPAQVDQNRGGEQRLARATRRRGPPGRW